MKIFKSGLNLISKPLSGLAKKILQKYIDDYGVITNLCINFANKEVVINVELYGEPDVVQLSLTDISVIADNGGYYLRFEKVKVSRIWIQKLIDNYLPIIIPNKRIEIDRLLGVLLVKVF